MNQPQTSQSRHIVPCNVTGLPEEARILANQEFDRRNGFNEKQGRYFTNPERHPETFMGRIEEIWNRVDKLNP